MTIQPTSKEGITPDIYERISSIAHDEASKIYNCLTNTRKFEVLGQNEQTEKAFWHRLYSVFQLKDTPYDETPEGIVSGLKDLSWHSNSNYALFIWNADQWLKDDAEVKEQMMRMLEEEIVPHWEAQDGHSFRVFMVVNSRADEMT